MRNLAVIDNTSKGKFSISYDEGKSKKYRGDTFVPSYNGKPLGIILKINQLTYINSLKITVKETLDGFARIKEWDNEGGTSCFYLDPIQSTTVGFHPVFYFKPNKEDFFEYKVIDILQSFGFPSKEVKFDLCAYNRHGIALFGGGEEYKFYWMNPENLSFKEIECKEIGRLKDGGSSYAYAKNYSVTFHYHVKGAQYFINGERASPLSWEFLRENQKGLQKVLYRMKEALKKQSRISSPLSDVVFELTAPSN